MNELLAAIDESDNLNFLAIVIGTRDSINSYSGLFRPNFKSISRLHREDKMYILDKLDFNGNIWAYCINFGLTELKNTLETQISSNRSKKMRNNITPTIGYALKYEIHNRIEEILLSNKCTIDDITFEIDNQDLEEYLKSSGLRCNNTKTGIVHRLSDCVAHANFRNFRLRNVTESNSNFKEEFHKKIYEVIWR